MQAGRILYPHMRALPVQIERLPHFASRIGGVAEEGSRVAGKPRPGAGTLTLPPPRKTGRRGIAHRGQHGQQCVGTRDETIGIGDHHRIVPAIAELKVP